MGGSPPLARGTVCTATAQIPLAGITPACAGNSGCSAGVTPSRWDHPRLRGEQNVNFPRQQHKRGSPPLARGTVSSSAACVVGTWITPACAGNSKRGEKRVETHRDHPRLRGEQTLLCSTILFAAGSPPLARGTGAATAGAAKRAGITPACAGNRLKKDLLYLVFYNIVFHFSISFS